jgi:Domain of unknown function (DUF5060)
MMQEMSFARYSPRQLGKVTALLSIAYLLAACNLAGTVAAQETGKAEAGQSKIWLDGERNLRFKIQEVPPQPFDIEFLATFQNDDGVSKTVPGFYDGDNQFCVRFTLPKSGKWR